MDIVTSNGNEKAAQLEFKELNPPQTQELLATLLSGVFGQHFAWDDGVEETARRVAKFWQEYVPAQEIDFNFTTFPSTVNQLIIVKDVEFSSICAHHLLPFYGTANVGYIPNQFMVGLSKIPRLVDYWARRPSTQETLTANIASDLKHRLEAMGVAVMIESRHTCMACRGVRKHNGAMITSEMRGVFLTAEAARHEFLALVGRDRI